MKRTKKEIKTTATDTLAVLAHDYASGLVQGTRTVGQTVIAAQSMLKPFDLFFILQVASFLPDSLEVSLRHEIRNAAVNAENF